ncbi:MAG: NmrA family NAD(P)-binding protein [Anaerolineae bacterium]|nr:NmrA family NAD(P)-binding protein [Anaerolineae bacterium]MCO5195921.1 NmrA family NAD(P)-binding protein [Anaerolineae bacterium]MCO5197146.1 NmrA family NAD(P)-binding protein [Anaerolineae bacterium]
MVLISGAGGKTGRAVTRALALRGVAVRAWVRRGMAVDGAAELIVGDMNDSADWQRALSNCDKLYHICPNMHEDEIEIGRKAITAAKNAGISHFVYHSVLHPQTQAMPHHWNKLLVEEMLLMSGLPFTILQPTAYVQNIRAQWQTIVADGDFAMPYPVTTRISLVDLCDVAAVAALVLTQSGHTGATYELVGSEPLTQVDVAALIGRVIGRNVIAREVPLSDWERNARAAGLNEYAINTLLAMFRFYADYGLIGSATALSRLLDRKPTPITTVFTRWSA